MEYIFPGEKWHQATAEDMGFDSDKLLAVKQWLNDIANNNPWRVMIVRGGYSIAEWEVRIARNTQISQASIDKSFVSCMLGIAIDEGKISGLDAKVTDYFPEMMDIGPTEGPRAGRYAFEKDAEITFRQLLSQTSGFMKPDHGPSQLFHYQTFGINLVTHAVAKVYGVYDSSNPDHLPGGRQFLDERIRNPIGASWDSPRFNFDHPPGAKMNIFGNGFSIMANPSDMARAGLLWLNGGRWKDKQLVPEKYLREATSTNSDVLAISPEEQWNYGHAFWTNDHGKLWPELPKNAFAASGAGSMHVFVCPDLDLVIAQTPGPWSDKDKKPKQTEFLMRVVDSLI